MKTFDKLYITPDLQRRWCSCKIDDESIEYINSNAFIKKACAWLKSKYGYAIGFEGATIEDFLNYMKG